MSFVLLLGGARSGKSAAAEALAARSGAPVTYVATGEARDAEMAERIARHVALRPPGWTTVEAPVDLLGAVRAVPASDFLLVDCLTLWVSNLMTLEETPAETLLATAAEVAAALARRPGSGAVVSNELGMGIIPANPLARAYREVLGVVNTTFAGQASRTGLLVAGRVLALDDVSTFAAAAGTDAGV
jgi:adenosyl cobinamide kinase/adenosyl cobinamide phosphate guanylyltransferase